MKRVAGTLMIVIAVLWAVGAIAEPYVPKSDGDVLEHVPARTELERLEPLRRRAAANPRDLTAALALAEGFLKLGRANADPRFTAYAEAALLPWMGDGQIPESVLVLQATALQNQHQFAPAMALLDRAAALKPSDPQVWLTRATLDALHNNVADTRRACARLTRTADTLVSLTCLAGIDSRNGRLTGSYNALRRVFTDDARLPTELRVWILTQLADMAERLGDDQAAERYFVAALRVAPDDGFTLAGLADLLNRTGRSAEVLALLRGREVQDNLLLRLSIAGQRAGNEAAGHWAALYAARVQAAIRDGDTVHVREQAWFALDVQHDAAHALQLAELNWQQQREPADVRLYWRAATAVATASERARAQSSMQQWLSATHYEDATLKAGSL